MLSLVARVQTSFLYTKHVASFGFAVRLAWVRSSQIPDAIVCAHGHPHTHRYTRFTHVRCVPKCRDTLCRETGSHDGRPEMLPLNPVKT